MRVLMSVSDLSAIASLLIQFYPDDRRRLMMIDLVPRAQSLEDSNEEFAYKVSEPATDHRAGSGHVYLTATIHRFIRDGDDVWVLKDIMSGRSLTL